MKTTKLLACTFALPTGVDILAKAGRGGSEVIYEISPTSRLVKQIDIELSGLA
ncbi:hypothetical protein PPEP_b0203 [Pseudoalteromonas peptidolytica F12-50-A1]|uniref:Uncharacterized protein n=1 Tax=Pseudoalteromonas peptidolytica F12-50-A1 TaxID=1315280 RepID=A0A8I0MZR7_9GAMM|nr:hypothetical protein [Pseudoalteromonas peptidolytica]MBE0348458.1 hypothetical protein [Pseudoalteromonas peptidolytica F12-50-A1]GEK11870.1 hypothetical protein PPE03_41190 [Pseudoalteromonas peptidolytica]